MAIFRIRQALAAAVTVPNVMNGSKFEFLSRPAVVSIWATDDGTGSAQLDFTLGNVVVAEDIPLNNAVVAGDIRKDSDFIGAGAGDAGDRIQIRVRNTDAVNAVNANIMIEIAEIG